jgi:hypothetical protein|nr:MAG TPA: hypothetical protein [Caudoviricetes sp.]
MDNMRNNYREYKLKKYGLPDEYIDVYMYLITRDKSYLPTDYLLQYTDRANLVSQGKLNKAKEELLLLFGRILIFGKLGVDV